MTSENVLIEHAYKSDPYIKWDVRFLQVARLVSTFSKDPSTQTGAVITDDSNRVISTGFNGFPQCMPDVPENYANREEKYSRIVHCEVNAQIFAHRDLHFCTLYTWPFASCDRCVVQMLQAGITRFVFPEPSADALTRWGAAFEKTKAYIRECDAQWMEYKRVGVLE
jgi:dCMP deaminase